MFTSQKESKVFSANQFTIAKSGVSNMEILWVSWKDITHPDAGGAEIVGEHHAQAWIAAGHTVHWVSTGYKNSPKNLIKDRITYEHIGKKWFVYTGLFHLIIFLKYITQWRNQYDFIVDEYHGVPTGMPLYVKKPMLAVIHEVAGDIWQKMFKFPISYFGQYIAEPLVLSTYKSTKILTVSDSTKNDLIKFGIAEENISVIQNGVESQPENILERSKEVTPTLVYLSELRPMKGFDRVYEAFKKIKLSIPNIQLWVLGNDKTDFADQIKSKIKLDNLESSITFFGKVGTQEKFQRLQKAHILVHGSYKEGWGMVVIEANSVGTPAVAFDAEGLRDSIKHGETGYLAKDEPEYVQYILELLKSQNKYQTFQINSYTWSKNFSWTQSTEQSLKLVNEIQNTWKS
jgi:glycosyltransferase involved in cell wall biosynthesis